MRIGGYKMDNRPDPRRAGEAPQPFPWKEQTRGWPVLVGLIVLLVVIVVVFA